MYIATLTEVEDLELYYDKPNEHECPEGYTAFIYFSVQPTNATYMDKLE